MTHITEDRLIARALGEPDTEPDVDGDAHLQSCDACRDELAALRATLETTTAVPVPERDDDYGARVWAKLEPRLRPSGAVAPSGLRRGRHFGTSQWLALAAALLLAAGAYWVGRQSAPAPVTEQARGVEAPSPGVENIRERVVLAALGEHLDRTERTLVELVNSAPGAAIDISAEQAWARDLLEANRLYRRTAGGAAAPALSQVLDELEPVLIEIANSPSRLTSEEFEALRDRIDARSLVFKVRVSGADVRARQRALIPGRARPAPSTSRATDRGELQS